MAKAAPRGCWRLTLRFIGIGLLRLGMAINRLGLLLIVKAYGLQPGEIGVRRVDIEQLARRAARDRDEGDQPSDKGRR
jgi:hypothetical protein